MAIVSGTHEPAHPPSFGIQPPLDPLSRPFLAASREQVVSISLNHLFTSIPAHRGLCGETDLREEYIQPIGRLGGVGRHVVSRLSQ